MPLARLRTLVVKGERNAPSSLASQRTWRRQSRSRLRWAGFGPGPHAADRTAGWALEGPRCRRDRMLVRPAYGGALPLQRIMSGLATVANALNADDPCLASIAAVHLQIPDLPSHAAPDDMEAADLFIKSGDWNPALHPRAATPPNPGWFAPTGGSDQELSPVRTAENLSPNQASGAHRLSPDDGEPGHCSIYGCRSRRSCSRYGYGRITASHAE